MLVQRIVELQARRGLPEALEIARRERPPMTTAHPSGSTPRAASRRR
jgi:hypothetical protein